MKTSRSRFIVLCAGFACAVSVAAGAMAATPLTVAYAGSMGAVMDKGLGPAFDATHGTTFQGMGRGAYGLARLLAARELRADVFIAITPGPIEIVQKAGLMGAAVPVASTQMVIAYSPESRFARDFAAAAKGSLPWYSVLERPRLRFGRTDPAIDPQGRNIVLTMQLAGIYYRRPDLGKKILGSIDNRSQIFTEASLLSRLQGDQIDAASAYKSAAISHHLPYVALPPEIDLGDPAMSKPWYSRACFNLPGTEGRARRVVAQPLVFYAGVLKNAAHPREAAGFIAFMRSAEGRKVLAEYGYGEPEGQPLRPAP